MSKQEEKRGPGRPRKGVIRVPVHITLPIEVLQYIDSETNNRSAFVEQCIHEHRQKWEELMRESPQIGSPG